MVSSNIRAALRNLWINGVVSLAVIGIFYVSNIFKITTLTPVLDQIVYWAVIGGVIAWIMFLLHCCGELFLELRKGNYHFLWSFLPFLLPLICFLGHQAIVGWLPWPFT